MSTTARRRIVLGIAFVAALAALLAWYLNTGNSPTPATGPAGAGRGSVSGVSEPFPIDGTAETPISPGVSVPLDLGFTNPYAATMSVTALHVRIRTITAPNADTAHQCGLDDFLVEQAASASPPLTVAPGMRSSLDSLGLPRADWPHVGMLDRSVNQDGCKGASLTLAYSASGTTSP